MITEGEVISIEGKILCSSHNKIKKSVVHMVSTLADINNIVLGQLNLKNIF